MPDISLGVIIRLDNITAEITPVGGFAYRRTQRYLMLDTGYSSLAARFSLLDVGCLILDFRC